MLWFLAFMLLTTTGVCLTTSVLVHVPSHTSESNSDFDSFLRCAFGTTPSFKNESDLHVDVLLVVSGEPSSSRIKRWSNSLANYVSPYGFGVFTEPFMPNSDVYDKTRSSPRWTAGPNEEFYAVMAEGYPLYERHTQRYDFVLQMETDVCTVGVGWLDKLLTGMTEQPVEILVSGATIRGECVHESKSGRCEDAIQKPDWVQKHINGNGLYKMTADLQHLFNHSLSMYHDWPFDLATWLSARDMGWQKRLYDDQAFLNVPHLVDEQVFADPTFFSSAVGMVHASRSMRVDAFYAALSRLNKTLPVTVTFVSASHLGFASNFALSLMRQRVRNVLCVVFDEASLMRMKAWPFQIAFAPSTAGSTAFNSSDYIQNVNKKNDAVFKVLKEGYSVVAMDVDIVIKRDYVPHLLTLTADRIYFSSESVGSYGHFFYGEQQPRYFFNSGVFYIPQRILNDAYGFMEAWIEFCHKTGKTQQQALNQMLVCTSLERCAYGGLKLGLLPPQLYINGGNYFSKTWPDPGQAANALVLHNNWANGFGAKRFRFRNRNLWPADDVVNCTNATQLFGGPFRLDGAAAPVTMSAFGEYFTHIATNGYHCAVIPGFVVSEWGPEVPFDVLFDFVALTHGLPDFTELLPAASWIRTVANVSLYVPTGGAPTHQWALNEQIANIAVWVKSKIPKPLVCVEDNARSTGEVALVTLAGNLTSILDIALEGNKYVLLTGKWRLLHQAIDSQRPAVFTSASMRVFPEHERIMFGHPFLYSRQGEDAFYDVLETIVCSSATARLPLRLSHAMTASQLSRAVARYIPADVLEEDLGLFSMLQRPMQERALQRRLFFSLDRLNTNGLSNRLGITQTLLYVCMKQNLTCVMPPFQPVHNSNASAPWSRLINTHTFFVRFGHIMIPQSILLLINPRVILNYLEGAQLALTASPSSRSEAVINENIALLEFLASTQSRQPYTVISVTSNILRHEKSLLMGALSFRPAHPYLGMNEEEWHNALANLPPDDIALSSAFRAHKFVQSDSRHTQLANSWHTFFKGSDAVKKNVDAAQHVLGPSYACAHVRILDEYLHDHLREQHGNKTLVLMKLFEFVLRQGNGTVYITADTDIRPWIKEMFAAPIQRVMTCFDLGCHNDFGDDSVQGFVDANICARAVEFKGNTYSSYTLLICAMRGDQACEDLFGRSLKDGRLLI